MQCPRCNRVHLGHERTPGAFSAVCEVCFDDDVKALRASRRAAAPPAAPRRAKKESRKAGADVK